MTYARAKRGWNPLAILDPNRTNCFCIQVIDRKEREIVMDEDLAHQILDELLKHLEEAETQSAAVLHFLKAKGIATGEQLTPCFEEASKATSVKWVAERARFNRLLSLAAKSSSKKSAEETPGKSADTNPEITPKNTAPDNSATQAANGESGTTAPTQADGERTDKDNSDSPPSDSKPSRQPETREDQAVESSRGRAGRSA
jgi:hypothetical protein